MGKQEGVEDAEGRGMVIVSVIKYIRERRPNGFLLENSDGLAKKFIVTLEVIISLLRKIEGYKVGWRVMNSKTHGSVQNRSRVYIVGFQARLESRLKRFVWPGECERPPLSSIINSRAKTPLHKMESVINNMPPYRQKAMTTLIEKLEIVGGKIGDPYVGDISTSHKFGPSLMYDCLPCVTRTRGSMGGFFLFKEFRMTDQEELEAAQGIPTKRFILPQKVNSMDRPCTCAFTKSIPHP